MEPHRRQSSDVTRGGDMRRFNPRVETPSNLTEVAKRSFVDQYTPAQLLMGAVVFAAVVYYVMK